MRRLRMDEESQPSAVARACTECAWQFTFVVEDGLGHRVHATNIERVLANTPGIEGSLIRLSPTEELAHRWIGPLARNWSLQASWLTKRTVQEHRSHSRVDALFIHTQVASLLSRPIMREVPTIISLDATPINFDTVAEAYGHSRQGRGLEWGKWIINKRALRAAAAIVTWSQWAADSVTADYAVPAGRVHVIPPGVDVARFRPGPRWDGDGPMRVLFIGGDFQRKGGDDLLEAMRRVRLPMELDIVSPQGVVPSGLPARVHGAVAANSERMVELLSRADVFALPSRGDCTPLAVAEALSSGLPIVTTTVGALPELVVDGWNGLVVPAADPQALAAALDRLASDAALRKEMARRSRRMAEAEHDVFKNCQRIFDVMKWAARNPWPVACCDAPAERRPTSQSPVRGRSR
jgi:glycosyltransferase involved in cell wall biosynthesis